MSNTFLTDLINALEQFHQCRTESDKTCMSIWVAKLLIQMLIAIRATNLE